MGNLQGSEKGKSSGKAAKGGLGKMKKSPARDLLKYQAVGLAVRKKTAQTPAEDPVPERQAVSGVGGGNDRSGTVTNDAAATTSCATDGALIVTDSWREVTKLQKSLESRAPVESSPSKEETSSSDSVFTDPLVTPVGASDYSDSRECTDCKRDEDDVTLTMDTSEEEESTPVASKRRSHTNSLDALEEEAEPPTKAKSLEPKTCPFTVVRHRKVELPPTKLNEQCLLLNTPSTTTGTLFVTLSCLFVFHLLCLPPNPH